LFIDSTGIGLLLRLQKRIRAFDRHLVLMKPTKRVQQTLALMRLDSFFDSAPTLSAAQRLIADRLREERETLPRARSATDQRETETPQRGPCLFWRGEITAVNADTVWEQTRQRITNVAAWNHPPVNLSCNLQNVRFIDSSGLGVMLRSKRLARQHGLDLVFTSPQPAALNVLRLAHLEEFLLNGS